MNQLTFGAGVSQFDGLFAQLSFATTNFLGRGETLSVGFQNGSRLRNINLGYSKPYMFGKNISAGANLFSRRVEWIGAYAEDSYGGSMTLGRPLAIFTRGFLTYSYEATSVGDVNPALMKDPNIWAMNPFFADSLMLSTQGRRVVSKISPSLRHNTVGPSNFSVFGRELQRDNGVCRAWWQHDVL